MESKVEHSNAKIGNGKKPVFIKVTCKKNMTTILKTLIN